MANINKKLAFTNKSALINAIKEHNKNQIEIANKAADALRAKAHEQASNKLLKANTTAKSLINTTRFEQIFFLRNGHINTITPAGVTVDLQATIGSDLLFGCLAFDPDNERLFAGTIADPFEIYQIYLSGTVISFINKLFDINSSPLVLNYNTYDNSIYWLEGNGTISRTYTPQITLNSSLTTSNLSGIKSFGNPQSISDPTFTEVLSFQGEQYFEFESSMIGSNIKQFTIEAWVWLDAYNDGTIFVAQIDNVNTLSWLSIGNTADEQGGSIGKPGYVYFRPSNQINCISSEKALELNQWNHIAVTSDGNEIILYVDGKQVGSINAEITLPFTNNRNQINCIGSAPVSGVPYHFAHCRLNNFSFTNRSCAPHEIADHSKVKSNNMLMNLGKPISSGALTIGQNSTQPNKAESLPQMSWSDGTNIWLNSQENATKLLDQFSACNMPTSISYDGKAQKIFWIAPNEKVIKQFDIKEDRYSTLCQTGDFAIGLTVDPVSSQLYWTQKLENSKILPPGLMADWVAEKTSYNVISSGNDESMMLTLHDTEWIQVNHSPITDNGWVLNFDGIKSYATIPAFTLDHSTGFSFETWVNFEMINREMNILYLFNSQNQESISLGMNSGGILNVKFIQEASTQHLNFNKPVTEGSWTHVSFSISSSGVLNVFLNGKPMGSMNLTLSSSIYWGMNSIGTYPEKGSTTPFFNGKIASIRLWSKDRSAQEITSDMDSTINSTVLMTCNEEGKVESICSMPLSNSLCLLSKDIVAYDQLLNNIHNRQIAQNQAKKDIAESYKKATQIKATAHAQYKEKSQSAQETINLAQNQATQSKRQANTNLLTAKNNATKKISKARQTAISTKQNANNQASQIKQNAQQKKQNMIEKANQNFANAKSQKAKYH